MEFILNHLLSFILFTSSGSDPPDPAAAGGLIRW
jgi:hypothetical protein